MTAHGILIGLILLFPWSLVALVILGMASGRPRRRLELAFLRIRLNRFSPVPRPRKQGRKARFIRDAGVPGN